MSRLEKPTRSVVPSACLIVLLVAACAEDGEAPALGPPPECDEESRPCSRYQVCERGKCRPAVTCESGRSGPCPEVDADGDALFCERELCVEACVPLPDSCPEGSRCFGDPPLCVWAEGHCHSMDCDCPSGYQLVPRRRAGSETLVKYECVRLVTPCQSDGDCEGSDRPYYCILPHGFCAECTSDEHCPADLPECFLEGYWCIERR